MNATLWNVLDEAAKNHPDRSEAIGQYREMVSRKGCGDVTMEQLLSHRSGLVQGDDYFNPGNRTRLEIYNSATVSFDPNKRGKVFSYCNPGFVLAEDMISLVSDSDKEGYRGELENRIIEPLKLTHTKSIYESEKSKESASEIVQIEGVMYDWGVESKKTVRRNPLQDTQKGMAALSEGGLCSSVGDLEEFYTELSKLACGMPNLLHPSFKKQVALEAIKGDKTIAQIAAEFRVFPARIHQWRKQLLLSCEQVFIDEKPGDKVIAKRLLENEQQIENLQKKVGELTMANDFYKKKFPS